MARALHTMETTPFLLYFQEYRGFYANLKNLRNFVPIKVNTGGKLHLTHYFNVADFSCFAISFVRVPRSLMNCLVLGDKKGNAAYAIHQEEANVDLALIQKNFTNLLTSQNIYKTFCVSTLSQFHFLNSHNFFTSNSMGQLHIALLPVMAHGHMIPMLEMAKLFISRGLKATIITTPPFADPIKRAQESGHNIGLSIFKFPPEGSSLPDNYVSLDQMAAPNVLPKFVEALALLQEPLERILQELHLNCLVSDMFWPWTHESAAKFGFPRLVFSVTSYFAECTSEQMRIHKPYKNLSSDSEPFVLPNLPHQLMFVRTQVSEFEREGPKNPFTALLEQMIESEGKSYGVLINSFYELESAYADHYKNVLGKQAWHIGPLSLCNNEGDAKAQRGQESTIDEHECLTWLKSRRPNSVVYVCFGSMATFTPVQLHEMAVGLEESAQDFIWVVRNGGKNEEWLPKGFEERLKGKALIIRGWAPQVIILDHPSIGAFVTHCGWNSILEGVCAGVPMVTWPVFAEQFFNEKLVTEVLRIGVSVGNKKWQIMAIEGVERGAVTAAVQQIMVGEEAAEMRSRAEKYKEMARKAVEEGGSSYNSLEALIEELRVYRAPEKQDMD